MAIACCLLRPVAPRAAASSCRCRLGSMLAAPPGGWRWGGSLAGGAAAPAAADSGTPRSSSPSSSSSSSAPGRGSTAASAAVRDDLLKGVAAENREDVARILEQAQRAADSWTVVHSDFYTPPVIADAMTVLQRMAEVAAVPWGGYPQAERCRLSMGREEALAGAAEDPPQLESVAAVQCRGNFVSSALQALAVVAGCRAGCGAVSADVPAVAAVACAAVSVRFPLPAFHSCPDLPSPSLPWPDEGPSSGCVFPLSCLHLKPPQLASHSLTPLPLPGADL